MTTPKEDVLLLLNNRNYLFKLLHRIFADTPDEDLLNILSEPHCLDAISLLVDEDSEIYLQINNTFKQIAEQGKDRAEILDRLITDYTRLYLGPAKTLAPPLESFYMHKENILFQECTLKVRDAYKKSGFLPTAYRRVADDHIGLELDFMAHMSAKATLAYSKEDRDEFQEILQTQKDFLTQHLTLWAGDFSNKTSEHAKETFYPGFGQLLVTVIDFDLELISELENI